MLMMYLNKNLFKLIMNFMGESQILIKHLHTVEKLILLDFCCQLCNL